MTKKHINIQFNYFKVLSMVLMLGCIIFTSSCKLTGQIQDPYYNPVLENPAYDVPTILVDASHNNFQQITGRFTGFARLARADGYRVEELTKSFDDCNATDGCDYWEQLQKADIFVLPHLGTPMSDGEAQVLSTWLLFGGSLLILTDHPPYDTNVLPLLTRLNMSVDNLSKSPITPRGATWDTLHPIVNGRNPSEQIETLSSNGHVGIQLDTQSPYIGLPPKPSLVVTLEEGDGLVAALEWGGRVVVVSDGSLMTEQTAVASIDVISGQIADGLFSVCDSAQSSNECMILLAESVACAPQGIPAEQCNADDLGHINGLTSADNQQFVLNILRWLSRIL